MTDDLCVMYVDVVITTLAARDGRVMADELVKRPTRLMAMMSR